MMLIKKKIMTKRKKFFKKIIINKLSLYITIFFSITLIP